MEVEELSTLAYQNAPPPRGLNDRERLYYEALRGVYGLYRGGLLPQEEAQRRKGELSQVMQDLEWAFARSRVAYAQYQEATRLAGTRKSEIVLALTAGKAPEEVLPLALDCIAAMTGEEGFPRLCERAGERMKKEEGR